MNEKYTNEDFLTRWVANELTKEEKDAFETSDVYRQFMVIDQQTGNLTGPEIDTEKALVKLKSRLLESKKIVPVRRLLWVASIAASFLILFGTYIFIFGNKTYSTGIGETETILLADGSSVELNANSSLSYKRFQWNDERSVVLTGEGYFKINSGAPFTVETDQGEIQVLGTSFNVRNRNHFKVQCYEGQISFTPNSNNLNPVQLSEGMQLELSENELLKSSLLNNQPDWKSGFSSFTQRPFSEVLEELSIQYPIKFDMGTIDTERLFTGQFTHSNLESALKSTMDPMGISYSISEDKRIITLSN
ncbi:FecR family protein [Maribacter cobaltidurans]|nr:FecR domain-containing protein [Maribacter cobaltidurans]